LPTIPNSRAFFLAPLKTTEPISHYYKDETRTAIFGIIRYILPNSDAATKPIARGDIFYAIDGQALNIDNYASLLNRDSYTMNLADYDGGNITPNGNSVSLTFNPFRKSRAYPQGHQ
jgi:hypothetical protein